MATGFWASTDPGRVREINEDSFLIDESLQFAVVCDGMGGHAAGEVASEMACRVAREVVAGSRDLLARFLANPNAARRKDVLTLLEFAVRDACARIFELAQRDKGKRGMGTTLSLLMLCERRCFIAHVGDSRIYLVRAGQAHQLTEDHTLINELRKRGKLAQAQANKVPFKNAVTRAVGVYETVEVDTLDLDVLPGDRFLLCSDGLHNYFPEDQAPLALIASEDPRQVPRHCIEFANHHGGRDNITAIVVSLEGGKPDGHTRRVQRSTQIFRALPLFRALTYKELAKVMNLAQSRALEEGEDPFSRQHDALHIILAGQVGAYYQGSCIERLDASCAFGLLNLLDNQPIDPEFSYRAEEETTLLSISRGDLINLSREDNALSVKLLWNISQTLTAQLRRHAAAGAPIGHLEPSAPSTPGPEAAAPPPPPAEALARSAPASPSPPPPPAEALVRSASMRPPPPPAEALISRSPPKAKIEEDPPSSGDNERTLISASPLSIARRKSSSFGLNKTPTSPSTPGSAATRGRRVRAQSDEASALSDNAFARARTTNPRQAAPGPLSQDPGPSEDTVISARAPVDPSSASLVLEDKAVAELPPEPPAEFTEEDTNPNTRARFAPRTRVGSRQPMRAGHRPFSRDRRPALERGKDDGTDAEDKT